MFIFYNHYCSDMTSFMRKRHCFWLSITLKRLNQFV